MNFFIASGFWEDFVVLQISEIKIDTLRGSLDVFALKFLIDEIFPADACLKAGQACTQIRQLFCRHAHLYLSEASLAFAKEFLNF